MLDIKDYLLEYKRKIPNILLLWTLILVFIITFVLIINSTFKIVDYYQVKGIVKNNKLHISVPIDEVKTIIDNDYIYIDKEKYKYEIKELSDGIINENNLFYQSVILDIRLKDKDFIDNTIVESKFIVKKMTILEYIYNLIKGDF